MDVTTQDLASEFKSLGIAIDESELSLCEAICRRNGVSAEDLVETWVAFSLNHNTGSMVLTVDNLLLMEKKELASCKTPVSAAKNRIVDLDSVPISNVNMKQDYSSPAKKTMEIVPGKPKSAEKQWSYNFPPKVIHSYGVEAKEELEEVTLNVEPLVVPDIEKDSCMYNTIKEEALLLGDFTVQIAETIKNNFNYSEEDNEDSGSYYFGRVVPPHDSKLNPSSIKLHNPDVGDVNIDVSQLSEYSLFPGQVVVVKGVRSGHKIIASHIYDNARLPLSNQSISIPGKMKLLVVSGPFIEKENDGYECLDFIAQCVKHFKPQGLVILGPIVNSKAFSSVVNVDFKSLFKQALQHLSGQIEKNVKVYCVVNKLDRCSIPVYPTLPPCLDLDNEIVLLPDPAVISVNGVLIALSSSDVLLHIAQNEIRTNRPERFLQLCDHCIKQQTMYPLYPPDITVGMDLKLWERYAVLSHSPHFVFFRSAFPYFVKESETKSVFINSGSISSKKSTKTLALLELHNCDRNDWNPSLSSCVKILKA